MLAAQFHALNSVKGLSDRADAPSFKRNLPIILLPSRLILFAVFQLFGAAIIWVVEGHFSYQQAGIFWPYTATGANVVTFALLHWAFKMEGLSVIDLYRFNKPTIRIDILTAVGVFIVAVPISFFPNGLLATLLFGNPGAVGPYMFGTMSPILAYLTVLLPLTIAFAEMPLYMGYILPRLGLRLRSCATAVLIVGFFLALQHCTLPLIIDLRFIIWRLGMFLPLAILFAVILNWRPRLIPYIMIGHALLDFAAVAMIVLASVH